MVQLRVFGSPILVLALALSACSADRPAVSDAVSATDATVGDTKVDNSPPKVQLASPVAGAYVSGSVTLQATVTDGSPDIQIRFFVDSGLVAEATSQPYAASWDSDEVAEGPHVLKVVATDAAGHSSTAEHAVTVDRTGPSLSFAAPSELATLSAATVILVDASDSVGVARVDFEAQDASGAANGIGSAVSAPFEVTWTTDGLTSGAWTLKATALDLAGHVTVATRKVLLDRPPAVTIQSPVAGASLSGEVQIGGSASDDLGLQSGEIRVDGFTVAKLPASGITANFAYIWDTAKAPYGKHLIEVRFTDSSGAVGFALVEVGVAVTGTAGMVQLKASSFWMGCNAAKDPACEPSESPQHLVTLSAFELDKTEVTVQAYKACFDAGQCPSPEDKSDACHFDVATKAPRPGKEKFPMNCVKWMYANAYCKAQGKRLPTEAEFERAIRGSCEANGSSGGDPTCAQAMRTYAWGDLWPPPKGAGNFADEAAKLVHETWAWLAGYDDGFADAAPVGSYTPTADGLYDLSGNVWEWVADHHSATFFSAAPVTNPLNTSAGYFRAYRGGGFQVGDPAALRASRRGGIDPAAEDFFLGFRCAKPIP